MRRWVLCLIILIKIAYGLENVRKPSAMCEQRKCSARQYANSVYTVVRKSDKRNSTRMRRDLVVKAPSLESRSSFFRKHSKSFFALSLFRTSHAFQFF